MIPLANVIGAAQAYADPDAYRPGQQVLRPDGSTFIQGDVSTYRETDIPDIAWAPRTAGTTGVDRKTSPLTSLLPGGASLFIAPAAIVEVVDGPRLHESGKYYLITYRTPGYDDYTVRRLRHSREGNG